MNVSAAECAVGKPRSLPDLNQIAAIERHRFYREMRREPESMTGARKRGQRMCLEDRDARGRKEDVAERAQLVNPFLGGLE
jgi:hypothetical protein